MGVEIDRTPIEVLMLRRAAPFAALFALFLLFGWALGFAPPAGLEPAGWRALLVFLLCLSLWVSQLLPLSVTSLLGLALLPLLDVLPAGEVYAMFGSNAVFFILGAFILAAGMMKTEVSEQLALRLLGAVGMGPRRMLLALLLLPAAMAAFMPEHAVAAVFLPIALVIVRGLKLEMGHPYAQSLFLALAWGAIIGGVATLLGGARGPLALGLVEELTGQRFSFLDWSAAALPLVLVMLAIAALVLLLTTPVAGLEVEGARARLEERRLELGPFTLRGRLMLAVLLLTVGAWIVLGHRLGLASIALVSVVAMFALRLVRWADVEEYVNWGVILMYGGAIAVGKALAATGAAAWLAASLLPGGVGALALLLLMAVATLLLTEGVSNSAAVAILLPVAIPVGAAAGVEPVTVALAVGIVSGFAFMLPMGTPPNALVYSTGYVRFPAMLGRGAVLTLSTFALFALSLWLWWPLLGRGV